MKLYPRRRSVCINKAFIHDVIRYTFIITLVSLSLNFFEHDERGEHNPSGPWVQERGTPHGKVVHRVSICIDNVMLVFKNGQKHIVNTHIYTSKFIEVYVGWFSGTRCSAGRGELGMIVYLHIPRCTRYYAIFSYHVPPNTASH